MDFMTCSLENTVASATSIATAMTSLRSPSLIQPVTSSGLRVLSPPSRPPQPQHPRPWGCVSRFPRYLHPQETKLTARCLRVAAPGFRKKVANRCSSDLLVLSEAGCCAVSQGTRSGAWHRPVMCAGAAGEERGHDSRHRHRGVGGRVYTHFQLAKPKQKGGTVIRGASEL